MRGRYVSGEVILKKKYIIEDSQTKRHMKPKLCSRLELGLRGHSKDLSR